MSLRETSFLMSRNRSVRPVAWGLWLLNLALLAAIVIVGANLFELQKRSAKAAANLARMSADYEALGQSGAYVPTAEDLAKLNADVAFFNSLSGTRALPLQALLAELEQVVPADVWLSQIVYNAGTGALTMSLRAESETALPPALSALEKASGLEAVILVRQLRVQEGQRTIVQYDIEAVAP